MTFLKRLFLILINQAKQSLGREDMYAKMTDEALVAKIVATNDTLLFGVLYDRYAKRVYNKCYGFSRSQDEKPEISNRANIVKAKRIMLLLGR